MSRAQRVLLVALTLLPLQARAALTCPRIDYAEARDWPVAAVESQYCKATQALRASVASSSEMTKAGMPGMAQRALQDARQCQEQQAMLARLLENLHHRPTPPACPS